MRLYLFLLFLFSGSFLSAQSYANYPYAKDQPGVKDVWPGGTKSFTVSSDVILYVPPDGWVLELLGTEEAPTLELARTKIQQHIDALTKKLNAMGIAASDITVTTESQERVSGWKSDGKGGSSYTTIAYSLTKSVLIRYTDVLLYSQILSEASLHGFDNVKQNYCTVADEQAVYAELYKQAMEVALEKQMKDASYFNANILPGSKVTRETYNVATPTPGVYVQPGVQRSPNNKYDRVIGGEYGNGAVRYTIHLEYTYTLQKRNQTATPNPVKIK